MAKTENLTIIFVDMVGFTERTSAQSRAENNRMLYNFNRLLLPQITAFGGRRVKPLGDALLAGFRSPTDAVRCGMAIQDALAEHNAAHPDEQKIQVRVGVNTGEVRVERKDVFGEAVNIASRVQGMTPVNEIYLTGVVYASMNKAEVPTESVGSFNLKGVPEPVTIYRVRPSTLARLVPAQEAMEIRPGELPYGGMNHLLASRGLITKVKAAVSAMTPADFLRMFRVAPRQQRVAWIAGFLGLVLAIGLIIANWDDASPLGTVLTGSPPKAVNAAVAQEVVRNAHEMYARGRKSDAAADYVRALALDPSVQNDPEVAENLVGAIYSARKVVTDAIRKQPSPAMIAALKDRTSQSGRLGAGIAADLLVELGHGKLVDRTGIAIATLAEADSCDERLGAVKQLRKLKDRRALEPLKEATSGMQGFFRNSCLSSEAKKAIEEIDPPKRSG